MKPDDEPLLEEIFGEAVEEDGLLADVLLPPPKGLSRRPALGYNPDQPRDPDGKFGEGGGGEKKKDEGGGADRARHDAAQQPMETSRKANAWGKENVVTEGGLSKEEQGALKSYQGTSVLINRSLRAGKPSGEQEVESDIKHMDAAMQRSTIKEDVVVRRGLGFAGAGGAFKEGGLYLDRGFVSTTINTVTAAGFGGMHDKVHLEILVPKGSRGVYLKGKGESEIVLDRGSVFAVHEVSKDKTGVTHVRMTLGMQGIVFGDDRGRKKQSARPGAWLELDDAGEGDVSGDPARFRWDEGDLQEYDDA